MRKVIYILTCLIIIIFPMSCKKFFNVKPLDRLSESSFWQTKQDVETALANDYGFIFDVLTNNPFNLASGEMRAGTLSWKGNKVPCFIAVGENDLNNDTKMSDPSRYNMTNLSDWYPFYQSIASCNISIARIPKVKSLSEKEIGTYLGEVRFIRAFTYFYISRLYGDVPLYVDAYDKQALPRTPMLQVLKFCLKECREIKDDLPWQYSDPTKWGVRASKGSVYALMANINMWMAGFDKDNQKQYWKAAADDVNEIIKSGNFELLPITQSHEIFRGRTKESLFEFEVNPNYGTATKYVSTGEWTTHTPIIDYPYSWAWYRADYVQKIFPPNEPDKRRDIWFFQPYANNNQTMFLKFSNVSDPTNWFFNDNLIMFRYGGVLLLGAEAMADLGEDQNAIKLLNMVRRRAGAPSYSASDGDLSDFIFQERQRELIGEGSAWYDLIRTGRVTDPNQAYDYLTQQEFNAGAWTWPIAPKARVNNPNIILNSYWIK